jgi:hypothetical protein
MGIEPAVSPQVVEKRVTRTPQLSSDDETTTAASAWAGHRRLAEPAEPGDEGERDQRRRRTVGLTTC